jgi:quercetin dioxygenase-like cupin family protein
VFRNNDGSPQTAVGLATIGGRARYTGWHTHPGPLLVVVESGTLTHYGRHCHAETYTAGEAFKEPAARRHVHMGINRAGTPVVLDVTYIVPSGGPLRNEAPAPKCAAKL